MAEVPIEELIVPRWTESRSAQYLTPNARAYIVASKSEGPYAYKVCMDLPYYVQGVRPLYPEVSGIVLRNISFAWGRMMRDIATTIHTSGGARRPGAVYRVIHSGNGHDNSGYVHDGIRPRGSGANPAQPFTFQVQVQRHLYQRCYDLSPFMSATVDLEDAADLCALYDAHGYGGIQILEIETTGPDWDHNVQRLWNVRDLLTDFDTRKLLTGHSFANEYLIEHSIPPSSVTRHPWDDALRARLDPDGQRVARARARLGLLEDKRGHYESRNRAHGEYVGFRLPRTGGKDGYLRITG
ncbi:Uu.00g121360.m01.CDS01 [Anthostomella pinea]|uniref:Uu.00g121360.m01.CDS01 n=1 Tax=Anthostomella pinea TaxID=933095 RepID=A0AAI8YHF7_9PEZI|nr:Uu.00g121360.m01.CDS01 [Anthostomella pinea]